MHNRKGGILMRFKKTLSVLAAAALAGTMLAGCGSGKDEKGGEDGGVVELTVWGPQEGQELLKSMCENFAAANPDKTYKFTYGVVSEADAKKEVLKDISAAADVFQFASDQTGELVDAGALYRVTKNKDQIVADNTEPSIAAATVNGELYAYP